MNRALPSALDEPPASLVDAMPVNEKDRHVLALALHVEAPRIVTENLRDFPAEHLEQFDVDAVSIDAFVLDHIEQDPPAVVGAIDAIAARRRRHPKTREDIIEVLRRQLPRSMVTLAT